MLLGKTSNTGMCLHLRGSHPLRRPLPRDFNFTHTFLLRTRPADQEQTLPTTPHTQPLPGITCMRFSLFRFRSPLLSESLLFSLPTGTEMFHFPAFPPHALYIQARVTGHDSSWVSPFGHPRITARLPTPQGLSQAPTSFIGSRCQGIHHVPFTACHHQHHTTPTHPTPHTQRAQRNQAHRCVGLDGSTLQRCSRPLSRSQTTTPHPPPHPHGRSQEAGNTETPPHPQPTPGQPTLAPRARGSDASEPQQCAPTTPRKHCTQKARTHLRGGVHRWIPLVNTTIRPAGRPFGPTDSGVCSLERR